MKSFESIVYTATELAAIREAQEQVCRPSLWLEQAGVSVELPSTSDARGYSAAELAAEEDALEAYSHLFDF